MNVPKPIAILETKIHPVRFGDVLRYIEHSVKNKHRAVLFPMNIHIFIELSKDSHFKHKHESANIIFCDGVPLIWLSKLKSLSLPERISGTNLTDALLMSDYRIFLLGSSNEVLEKMKKKYINICGTYSPPYATEWGNEENKKIIKRIHDSRADILLIGVGPLKQERWVVKYKNIIKTPIIIAVGSAFDILSGNNPRAPKIMQYLGLEWVWRILLEPKRLGYRYCKDSIAFFHTVYSILLSKIV